MIIDTEYDSFIRQTFWKLCGQMTLRVDEEKYPDWVFIFRDDICMFQYNKKSGNFYVNYSEIWLVLEKCFNLEYDDIQQFIKDEVEEHFKFDPVTAFCNGIYRTYRVEEHFKFGPVTPFIILRQTVF